MADIFVSYTSSDREWAHWIAKELEALGHTPHIYEWEVKSGDDIYAWMEKRHDAADHVLCVISDEYLKAPYSTLERNAALWQTASKRPGFVLLVAVKPCRFPTLTDHLRRCELYGIPDNQKRQRLREFMARREAPSNIVLPGAYAVSNIPIRVPTLFMGRDDALEAIETALKRYEGRVAITALHGLRGVGKTTLAAAYAERHRGAYRATWWLRAQTEPTIRADLVALGVRLGWVAADEKEEPAVAIVMERLRQEGEGILLIYDNAIDANALRPYLPPGGRAQVLVTSNAHAWRGVAEPVEIRLWPKEIGADYLIKRTGRTDERGSALALSEALGGLPLAHEQAAAYCERLGIALGEYARRFEAAPAKFLDDTRHAAAEYHDGLTVAKTFALAIDEAAKLHPAAEPLIVHTALLAPEPIPLFLFAKARYKFGEPLVFALKGDGLDEVVAALRTFGLLDRETIVDERDPSIKTDCIRLHRLVRETAATRAEANERARIKATVMEAIEYQYPERWDDLAAWPVARRLLPHAMFLLQDDTNLIGTEGTTTDLLTKIAGQFEALSLHAQARSALDRASPAFDKTVDWYNTRDFQYQMLIAGTGALRRAPELFEKIVGPEHPQTNHVRSQLASILLSALGNSQSAARALTLAHAALANHEKILGFDHSWTKYSARVTADALDALGRAEEAAAVRERYEITGPEKSAGS